MTSKLNFTLANEAITNDIKKMLRLVGHYDLGTLEDSINEFVVEENGDLRLRAQALDYIRELEYGVDADKIDEKKIDIAKLTGWVSRKITPDGAQAIAYAIIKKWKREGKPSDTSSLLSVERTFQDNQPRYASMIDDVVVGGLDDSFNTIKSGTV